MVDQERLAAALADRYRIEREIGEGGMATVYLAEDLKHDRSVALKVLKPELAALMGGERFLAEIKTTANLQHPHILPLFDSGEADGFLFYVMPYIEGESLRDRLERERQLPVEDAISIARGVGNALDYAHRQGVVHRDIKPENILLHDGEPLVADFGIALAVSAAGGERLTGTGLSLGTPHYMSPEQASADRELDGRSDLYSLGATLYEMLAGEPPFTGPSAQAVVSKILTEDARAVTEGRPSVPAHVSAAIQKALAKLPADRFSSPTQFTEALADPTFALPVGGSGHVAAVGAEVPRDPWNRVSVALLALAATLMLVAAWGWLGRTSLPDPVPMRLTLDLGETAPQGRDDVVVAPDGSAFAFAGVVGDRTVIHVRRADEGEFRPLAGTEWARFPAFSPDGDWIVFVDGYGGSIRKVATEGGAPTTVLPGGELSNPMFLHWGDDGFVVFRAREGLFRISESGGEPEVLLPEAFWACFPTFLPGGQAVLYTDVRVGSIFLMDLRTDSTQLLISVGHDAKYLETGHILYAHPEVGLYVVPFDLQSLEVTGEPVQVLDDVWLEGGSESYSLRAHYSVSESGVLVYGSGSGRRLDDTRYTPSHLIVASFQGDTTVVPLAPRSFLDPRWSPDGGSIAFLSRSGDAGHVFTCDLEMETTPRQLTFEGHNADPVWSPDGSRVAFTSMRDGTDEYDLFVKTVNDDTPVKMFLSRPGSQYPRHWISERFLVFEDALGSLTELWITDPSLVEETRPYLMRGSSDLDDIVVSPDGSWAAYQSDETGVEEVFVRRFPDPLQPIPVSSGGGQYPRWAPDGSAVYYWLQEGAAIDTLMAARVRQEPSFSVLSRDPVLIGSFEVEDWDLHPDGDRIIVVQRVNQDGDEVDSEAERFFVVVNWFEELKERLGR
jgi:serine/threonine-protein kinase